MQRSGEAPQIQVVIGQSLKDKGHTVSTGMDQQQQPTNPANPATDDSLKNKEHAKSMKAEQQPQDTPTGNSLKDNGHSEAAEQQQSTDSMDTPTDNAPKDNEGCEVSCILILHVCQAQYVLHMYIHVLSSCVGNVILIFSDVGRDLGGFLNVWLILETH